MQADEPDHVAARILEAIQSGAPSVTIGAMERIYGLVHALAPRLIDRGIAPQIRRLHSDFS
jgi:hypothetical protein